MQREAGRRPKRPTPREPFASLLLRLSEEVDDRFPGRDLIAGLGLAYRRLSFVLVATFRPIPHITGRQTARRWCPVGPLWCRNRQSAWRSGPREESCPA